jgi:hypothetical protein
MREEVERQVDEEKVAKAREEKPSSSSGASETAAPSSTLTNERDFENLVLMRMRQAQERKRLLEQMANEDEGEDAKKTKE